MTSKGGSKKERYFWQYNVQAKGPKGQRLVIKTQAEDPHVLNEVTDPVFSPTCSVRGIKVNQSEHSIHNRVHCTIEQHQSHGLFHPQII